VWEFGKFAGVLAYPIGLFAMFTGNLLTGLLILIFAVVMSIASVMRGAEAREERRAAALSADIATVRRTPKTSKTAQPSVADRLAKLDALRADGVLTDEEYERRRAEIIAEL